MNVEHEKESQTQKCLSESFMHLLSWPIFRQLHSNFITVRTAYASEIWVQLTKDLLTKSGTERFRENITQIRRTKTMKLVYAIVRNDNEDDVVSLLNQNHYSVTRLSTTVVS